MFQFTKVKEWDFLAPVKKLADYYKGYYAKLLKRVQSYPELKKKEPVLFDGFSAQKLHDMNEVFLFYGLCRGVKVNIYFNKFAKEMKKLMTTGHVYCVKKISFNYRMACRLMLQVMGDATLDEVKTRAADDYGFNDGDMYVVLYESEFSDKSFQLEILGTLFNENSIQLLDRQVLERHMAPEMDKCRKNFNTYKKWLSDVDPLEQVRFLAASSVVLFTHGIRACNDIDSLAYHLPENKALFKKINDEVISDREIEDNELQHIEIRLRGHGDWKNLDTYCEKWMSSEWPALFGANDNMDMIFDPRFHYYFNGVKIMSFSGDVARRLMRRRPASTADLFSIRDKLGMNFDIPPIASERYVRGKLVKENLSHSYNTTAKYLRERHDMFIPSKKICEKVSDNAIGNDNVRKIVASINYMYYDSSSSKKVDGSDEELAPYKIKGYLSDFTEHRDTVYTLIKKHITPVFVKKFKPLKETKAQKKKRLDSYYDYESKGCKNVMDQIAEDKVTKFYLSVDALAPYFKQLYDPKCNKDDKQRIKGPGKPVAALGGIGTISFKKGYKVYKGMDNFITPLMEENHYKNITTPYGTWFGDSYTAVLYTLMENGGLNVYKFQQHVKLIWFDDKAVEFFYHCVCELAKHSEVFQLMKRIYEIVFGIGINTKQRLDSFHLLSRSPVSVCDQNEPAGIIYCNTTDDLTRPMRGFNSRRLVFNYVILPILDIHGFAGVIAPQHLNPLLPMFTDHQEFIIGNPLIFSRDTSDPLDWCNWTLPFELEPGFVLHGNLGSMKNQEHQMIKFYNSNKYQGTSYFKRHGELVVCTLNVHSFVSINSSISREECINGLLDLLKNNRVDIVALQEITKPLLFEILPKMKELGFRNHTNMPARYGHITFSRMPLKNRRNVMLGDKRYASVYTVLGTRFVSTHLSVGEAFYFKFNEEGRKKAIQENVDLRVTQLKAIMDLEPDVVMGDFNFGIDDPEFKVISDKYKTDTSSISLTTPFGTIVDFVFYASDFKKEFKNRTLPYHFSDHLPVISTVSGFF